MARNCAGLHRPILAIMTTAARVAWGHHGKEWSEEKQRGHDHRGGHHPGQLAAGACAIVHGRLRCSTTGRHVMKEAADKVGHAGGHQFTVGIGSGLSLVKEGATRRRRFDETHEGDPEGCRPELLHQGTVGESEGRQPRVKRSHQRYARLVQPEQCRGANTDCHGDQCRWYLGREMLQAEHQGQHHDPENQSRN